MWTMDTNLGYLAHLPRMNGLMLCLMIFSAFVSQASALSAVNAVSLPCDGFPVIRTLTGRTSYVRSVDWSPDGSKIVSGSYDNTVKIWESSTGNLIRTLTGYSGGVFSVEWSPDGAQIASGSDDNTVKIWPARRYVPTLPALPSFDAINVSATVFYLQKQNSAVQFTRDGNSSDCEQFILPKPINSSAWNYTSPLIFEAQIALKKPGLYSVSFRDPSFMDSGDSPWYLYSNLLVTCPAGSEALNIFDSSAKCANCTGNKYSDNPGTPCKECQGEVWNNRTGCTLQRRRGRGEGRTRSRSRVGRPSRG